MTGQLLHIVTAHQRGQMVGMGFGDTPILAMVSCFDNVKGFRPDVALAGLELSASANDIDVVGEA